MGSEQDGEPREGPSLVHTSIVLGPWRALSQYSLDLWFISYQLIWGAEPKAATVEAY